MRYADLHELVRQMKAETVVMRIRAQEEHAKRCVLLNLLCSTIGDHAEAKLWSRSERFARARMVELESLRREYSGRATRGSVDATQRRLDVGAPAARSGSVSPQGRQLAFNLGGRPMKISIYWVPAMVVWLIVLAVALYCEISAW